MQRAASSIATAALRRLSSSPAPAIAVIRSCPITPSLVRRLNCIAVYQHRHDRQSLLSNFEISRGYARGRRETISEDYHDDDNMEVDSDEELWDDDVDDDDDIENDETMIEDSDQDE